MMMMAMIDPRCRGGGRSCSTRGITLGLSGGTQRAAGQGTLKVYPLLVLVDIKRRACVLGREPLIRLDPQT
jgi:hypothetical protein